MRKRKGRKSFLFWGIGILLLFLGSLSLLHIPKSSYVHKAAKERMNSALLEKKYVRKQLEDLQTYMLKKRYNTKRDGFTEKEKFKKIEFRGPDLSLRKNKPFSKSEIRFNIIKQTE